MLIPATRLSASSTLIIFTSTPAHFSSKWRRRIVEIPPASSPRRSYTSSTPRTRQAHRLLCCIESRRMFSASAAEEIRRKLLAVQMTGGPPLYSTSPPKRTMDACISGQQLFPTPPELWWRAPSLANSFIYDRDRNSNQLRGLSVARLHPCGNACFPSPGKAAPASEHSLVAAHHEDQLPSSAAIFEQVIGAST